MAAADDGLGFELTSDFYSKYIWRGQQVNDDPVSQTSISVSYKGLTASIWGNLDLTDYGGNSGEFTEWDSTLDYSGTIGDQGKIGYSLGFINYHFPSIVGDTTEFYWGFNFDVPLSPYITVYHDIGNIKGTYVNVGISHSIEKIARLTENIPIGLDFSLSAGWADSKYNNGYWGVDKSGINDLLMTVGFPIDLGNGWTVTPNLNYSTIISSSLRDSSNLNGVSDSFYSGVSIAKSF